MSAFLCITTLLTSDLPRDDIISFLNRVKVSSLKQYLRYAKIYTGSGIKLKNQLIEMIIYGFICDKLNDIPPIECDRDNLKKTIEKCNINITKLSSYGNCDKRKEEFHQLMLCIQKIVPIEKYQFMLNHHSIFII